LKIGLGRVFTSKPNQDYKKVIALHAKDGWRFVQIFAPATSGYGSASYFELIFEKEKI
jgi:hypothetical protein